MAVSVIESGTRGYHLNELANPAITAIVVDGYETIVGEEIEDWQR